MYGMSNGESGYKFISDNLRRAKRGDIVLLDCPENYGLDSANQRVLVSDLRKISRNGIRVITAYENPTKSKEIG